ncbi:MAG: MarR family EPS-associated transcriptional regulator [Betaproteobacteria bacterium]|nr:MarR family EPS-associated transcriptional regulator [Betaproteobacteria bacterium]
MNTNFHEANERSLAAPAGSAPPAAAHWRHHGDLEAARLAVLRALAAQPDLSQRALSAELGLSLGKTHYVLHALLDKGLVKVRNFRRSPRKLSYAYVLTPSGMTEKFRLTIRFLARKEAEFETLQQTIAALRSELRQDAGRHPAAD